MKKRLLRKLNLTFSLIGIMFAVLVVTSLIILIGSALFRKIGFLPIALLERNYPMLGEPRWIFYVAGILVLFISIGTVLTAALSKRALEPIRKVIKATHEVANGNFSTRINLKGIGELEDLSQSFNKMIQELENIETLRSDFINNLSHEFKTPIMSINGFAELLKKGELGEGEKQEYLDIIIVESKRLADLSTNILNLSKYEHIDIIPDKNDFRLDEQICLAVALLESKWTKKNITIDAELDKVVYNGNEDLTQQIWLNLLDNAIKFSHQDGLIIIKLTSENDMLKIVVQDNGLGMTEETRKYVFDKFFQGDKSRKTHGNGLGLTIVDKIISLHGGQIEIESRPNEGTAVTVMLPKSSLSA